MAVNRQIVKAVHLHLNTQIPRFLALGKPIDEVETEEVAVLVDGIVDFIDMQQALAPPQHKTGDLDTLVGQNPLQVNMLLRDNHLFHQRFHYDI